LDLVRPLLYVPICVLGPNEDSRRSVHLCYEAVDNSKHNRFRKGRDFVPKFELRSSFGPVFPSLQRVYKVKVH